MELLAIILSVIALIVAIHTNNRRKDNLRDIEALVENGLTYKKHISELSNEILDLKKKN